MTSRHTPIRSTKDGIRFANTFSPAGFGFGITWQLVDDGLLDQDKHDRRAVSVQVGAVLDAQFGPQLAGRQPSKSYSDPPLGWSDLDDLLDPMAEAVVEWLRDNDYLA